MANKLNGHNHVESVDCYAGCPAHPNYEQFSSAITAEDLAKWGYIKQPTIVAVVGHVIYDNGNAETFSAYDKNGLLVQVIGRSQLTPENSSEG